MSQEIAAQNPDHSRLLKKIAITGELSKLTEAELYDYNLALCQLHNLNPLTQPFNFLKLKDGRVVPYANQSCTNQLRQNYGASAEIIKAETVDDVMMVWTRTFTPDGRSTDQIGAVSMKGSAEDRANAAMKAVTKSFRRGMLTHCGLAVMDQGETEILPSTQEVVLAQPKQVETEKPEVKKEW